jgi:hypothetical protein
MAPELMSPTSASHKLLTNVSQKLRSTARILEPYHSIQSPQKYLDDDSACSKAIAMKMHHLQGCHIDALRK